MTRRGRVGLTDSDMWGSSGRMVHRKIDHPLNDAESTVKGVLEQLSEDRAAMVQMQGAIQAIAKAVNDQNDGMHSLENRIEEQTRMRLGDHRLNIGAHRSYCSKLKMKGKN